MVNTCQPHRVHIVALVQVKYLLCAKATTRECVGRVAEREKLLARKLPVLQYTYINIPQASCGWIRGQFHRAHKAEFFARQIVCSSVKLAPGPNCKALIHMEFCAFNHHFLLGKGILWLATLPGKPKLCELHVRIIRKFHANP